MEPAKGSLRGLRVLRDAARDAGAWSDESQRWGQSCRTRRDGSILAPFPGTSCQATINRPYGTFATQATRQKRTRRTMVAFVTLPACFPAPTDEPAADRTKSLGRSLHRCFEDFRKLPPALQIL